MKSSVLAGNQISSTLSFDSKLAVNVFNWNNVAGGDWNTGPNWTPNGPPGAGNAAVIAVKGTYRLMMDMIEEGHCWFHQTGSAPWEEELAIRE